MTVHARRDCYCTRTVTVPGLVFTRTGVLPGLVFFTGFGVLAGVLPGLVGLSVYVYPVVVLSVYVYPVVVLSESSVSVLSFLVTLPMGPLKNVIFRKTDKNRYFRVLEDKPVIPGFRG